MLWVGWHWLFAPHTDASLEDFFGKHFGGSRIVAVFFSNLTISWSDRFLGRGMAGEASGVGDETGSGVFFGKTDHSGIIGWNLDSLGYFGVGDSLESAIGAVVPGRAVFEEVDFAFWAHFHVAWMDEAKFGEPRLVGNDVAIFVEFDDAHPGAGPVIDDKAGVKFRGESIGEFRVVGVVVDRSRTGGGAWVEPEGGLRRRKFPESSVAGSVVDGLGGIESLAEFFGDEVVVGIGLVVGGEVRPAKVAGFAGLVDFIVAAGATLV